MTEQPGTLLRGWRYGIHPAAPNALIRSLGRVDLPLGEALRLEMTSPDEPGGETVHLQYYLVTDAGPWALWVTCQRAELAEREDVLRQIQLSVGDTTWG